MQSIKRYQLKSFVIGGFECADHINRSGDRINLRRETLHDENVYDDYKALKDIGISVVREGICWSEVEKIPYQFDFMSLISFFEASKRLEIKIIWDLCHFGYPDGLIPTHPQFAPRFEALCKHFILFHRQQTTDIPWIVPINEISFLSFHSGDVRGTVPFAVNSGSDIKYHLCKASILGMKAIRQTFEATVIMAVEPLIKIHPSPNKAIDNTELESLNEQQFQAMDMLIGRQNPELGGEDGLIDILGVNYYYNNQWTHENETLPWPEIEPLKTPLSILLEEVQQRYRLPLILTETGHFGMLRALWIKEVFTECARALSNAVNLLGICIYPVIDRPNWDDLTDYSNCGLWDMDENGKRIPHATSLIQLFESQKNFRDNSVEFE